MTDPCVEAVARAMIVPLGYVGKTLEDAEHIWVGNNIDDVETGSLAYLCRSLAEAAIAAMHSSRPVEDGRVLAETAYAQEGPAREGETHGHHVLRIAEKAASLALTTQASELSALKGEIERKDAAIRRYVSVHGVLTDDDREYLRQALTPEKATTKAGDDK